MDSRPNHRQARVFDAAVVGGGPAGLAAATWLARYRRKVALVDGGEQRNRWVDQAHGYLGFDPVAPADLLDRARQQLQQYECVDFVRTSVERVDGAEGDFTLHTADAGDLRARRLVLATGVVDAFPEVDGFFEHYGASVFHCPTCDGFEARDCDVVVFGWTEHVAGFALNLLDWARSVVVVTDGHRFEGDDACRDALARHDIRVLEDEARAFVGERNDLRGVQLGGGEDLLCQLAFFSIAHRPRNELAKALGCDVTGEGCVCVDDQGLTSVPGVYAAGDLVPGLQLIQVATASGTVAGVACALSLHGDRTVAGSPDPAPDVEAELNP